LTREVRALARLEGWALARRLLIAEFPNEKVASSGILVAMAGGGVSNAQTTVAMTSKPAIEAFSGTAAAAESFKSAGK
jgi:hypothetical protein